ncbi:MAG: ABC transporter ATP-binding protein [Ruminococcus sp.]|nr:ABC transporter ATP-binding protein [Ruminococcus sp.]
MSILKIDGLCKSFGTFALDNVSFCVEEGTVMGFIGRNGAGKTTTLKAVLGLVHPDAGVVEFTGKAVKDNELFVKQNIGVVLGGVDYYPTYKIKTIAKVTAKFYDNWDWALFDSYLEKFNLDKNKRIKDLSAGMKVKFALAMALSHGAKLLLLDEPTSGLDPVSRDEIIGIFIDLIADGQHSILFSTHIISDLEKCADYITYIQDGRIIESTDKESFAEEYRVVSGGVLTPELEKKLIGVRKNSFGYEAMIKAEDEADFVSAGANTQRIGLEDIMIHLERE